MNSALSLQGKVALVTGGGRGIGRAIARRLAEAGASVVIASRKIENLEATAREFASLPGRIFPIACHVGRVAEVENLVEPGQINPDHIVTPGVYVKRIVHVPNAVKHIEQRTVRKRVVA